MTVDQVVCPECGEEIVANTCQTSIRTREAAEALAALLLAVHYRMAHPDLPKPDPSDAIGRAFFSLTAEDE